MTGEAADMTHEEVLLLLPDFLGERLEAGRKRLVSDHLGSCRDCAAAASGLRLLMARAGETGQESEGEYGHPDTAEIVEYAIARDSFGAARAAAVESHLETCPTCREEVELTQRAHRVTAPERAWRAQKPGVSAAGWPASARAALAAAALLVAVLVYPAYLGVARLSVAKRKVEALSGAVSRLEGELRESVESLEESRALLERVRGWGAAVAPTLLQAGSRSGSERQVVHVVEDWPVTAVDVDFPLPLEAGGESDLVAFEVVAGEEEAVRSRAEIAVAQAARSLRELGAVLVLLPSASLEAGDYELRVSLLSARGKELLSSVPFTAVRDVPGRQVEPEREGTAGTEQR